MLLFVILYTKQILVKRYNFKEDYNSRLRQNFQNLGKPTIKPPLKIPDIVLKETLQLEEFYVTRT